MAEIGILYLTIYKCIGSLIASLSTFFNTHEYIRSKGR